MAGVLPLTGWGLVPVCGAAVAGGVVTGGTGEGVTPVAGGVGVRRGWTTPGRTTVVGTPLLALLALLALFSPAGSREEMPVWVVVSVGQQGVRWRQS